MIDRLAKNQNWAKAAPVLAILTSIALVFFFRPSNMMFWALVNIPLYLFHQTEEHLWPGGFKSYINTFVNKDPEGIETLTDVKVFWINIVLVWIAFALFGALAFVNPGFGLLIIVFSLINCATHIRQAIVDNRWNPGLVMASIQFVVCFYAGWFVTTHGLAFPLFWWTGTVAVSAGIHALLFTLVMRRKP